MLKTFSDLKFTNIALVAFTFLGVVIAVLQWKVYQQQTNIMLSTQKAILNVRRIRVDKIIEYNKPTSAFAFVPEVENVGVRPTFRCIASTHHVTSNKRISVPGFDFVPNGGVLRTPGKPQYRGPFPRYFGPKAVTDGPRTNLPLGDVQSAYEDKSFIYVWGWLDYDDGFAKTERRRTEFAVEVIVRDDPLTGGDAAFRFATLERHNGADEGCYRYPVSYKAGLAGQLGKLRPAQ